MLSRDGAAGAVLVAAGATGHCPGKGAGQGLWAVPEGKSHAAQSPVVPQPALGPGLAAAPWPRSQLVQMCNAGRAAQGRHSLLGGAGCPPASAVLWAAA